VDVARIVAGSPALRTAAIVGGSVLIVFGGLYMLFCVVVAVWWFSIETTWDVDALVVGVGTVWQVVIAAFTILGGVRLRRMGRVVA
jgi:hypothetical protein